MRAGLTDPYRQSITDACIGWDDTVVALTDLAHANTTRPTADTCG